METALCLLCIHSSNPDHKNCSSSFHYIFCFRTKKEMNNWIQGITSIICKLDLYPACSCLPYSEKSIKIQILKISSESVNNLLDGRKYHLLILSNLVQICLETVDNNPVLLSIEKASINCMKQSNLELKYKIYRYSLLVSFSQIFLKKESN